MPARSWLLFLDADCRPPSGLLDSYFREPFAPEVGVVAGSVEPLLTTGAPLIARYAASRQPDMQAPSQAYGRPERALFALIDVAVIAADLAGFLLGNRPKRSGGPPAASGGLRLAVMVDAFPELSETFVVNETRALLALGHRVRVEALTRAGRPDVVARSELHAHYLEDDGLARRCADLGWLLARHPLRCARDLAGRKRWANDEPVLPLRAVASLARRIAASGDGHLHAHFARGSALLALRLGGILGLPYSVTAHAWDIYKAPANLAEKLETAKFACGTCDYVVRDLRAMVSPEARGRIHRIVMGVDPAAFRPVPGEPERGSVVAVGRLVEKKGFAYLVQAAALSGGSVTKVTIVGEGPLRPELERLARDLGVADRIEFAGSRPPAAIPGYLARSWVLAMPCVVASDGDRDSMPVVVKEALAMEVPVVATLEVGLPELVREEWGRLVPPRDAEALAGALEETAALSPERRREMGSAGRKFVESECNVLTEARELAALVAAG